MIKFLLLGLGAIAFFCSACNDDVSLATSDVVVDSSSSVAPVPVEESSSSESSNSALHTNIGKHRCPQKDNR